MVEMNWQDTEPNRAEHEQSNVVDFATRLAAAATAARPEPYFSDMERREIREMLAYYRTARPQFEALKRGCPTARNLLDD